jgi:hypothetical protein
LGGEEFKKFKEFEEFKEWSQEPESRSQEDACACETANGREGEWAKRRVVA